MHVLYLHQYFVPPDGVGGTRSYEMSKRIINKGYSVTVVTSNSHFPPKYIFNNFITKINIDDINLIVLKVPYRNDMSYTVRIISFIKFALGALLAVVKVKNVDVVFASSTPLTIVIPGVFAKFINRCPMVFEVRDLWPELPIAMGAIKGHISILLARILEKFAYKQSSRVVALSPGMADGVSRSGYPTAKIEIVPNSCDTEMFKVTEDVGASFLKKNAHLAKGPLIVYTGSIGYINGIGYLVDIAHEMIIIRPDVQFLIIGWGVEKSLIERRSIALEVLNKNLWIVDYLPKANMPQVLSAATIATSFVIDLPELWNNSANKFFDSLAAGRPIMINHEGWQADFLRETGAGIVLPPSDPKTSAKMICDFLGDEARVHHARRAAVKASETIFNRDFLASRLIKTLEAAVAEH